MSEKVTRRLVARGRVQGVWFREGMRQEAARLGITGWVRNRMDGSVEAMVAWARHGPEAAHVASLDVSEASGDYPAFEKRHTE